MYAILKFIKRKLKKTIAQLSIWICWLGILDIDTQLNSLELNVDLKIIKPHQCFLESSHAVLIERKE